MSFRKHLADAIRINKERAPYYQEQTNNKSKQLSQTLISLEYLGLPIASYFEHKAKPYNQNNIPIIKNDFISMNVADQTRNPPHQQPITTSQLEHLKNEQKQALRALKKIRSPQDLKNNYQQSKNYLEQLSQHEQENQTHLSMTKHLLESYIFINKNSMTYAEQSNNQTLKLSKQLLNLHLQLLKQALNIDKQANVFHQQGVGIIYNDLPEYPDL